MKNSIPFAAFVALLSVTSLADGNVSTNAQVGLIKFGKKMVTREYAKQAVARAKYRLTGGLVRKPDSAKGYVVLLNAQKTVQPADFASVLATIDKKVRVQMKTVNLDALAIGTIRDEITKAGGNIGVALVDDSTLPALLSAPEEGWGLVNVAKLGDGDKDKLASRTRREILRAFGLAGGAMYAAQGDFVLQPVRKPADLDGFSREEFGATMSHIFSLALPYFGISQWQQSTYKKACEDGWASAPTNDVQKAIWDKVHAMPTAPIKIKPETKKVEQ